jgi:hypothetical protein
MISKLLKTQTQNLELKQKDITIQTAEQQMPQEK